MECLVRDLGGLHWFGWANSDPCRYHGHDWYGVDPLSVELCIQRRFQGKGGGV